jgi:3-oxoacyl-[acyl-carrier protein] reductase
MARFDDTTVIVTGGSRGIGKATAALFALEGANVMILDVMEDVGRETVNEIASTGGKACFMKVDVCDQSSLQKALDKAIEEYGKVDVLINNAGITADSSLKKMTEEQFDKVIAVNLKGVFNCTKIFGMHMAQNGKGAIINASSIVAHYGNFGQTNYVATKTGVIGMTKVWARELGPKGVRVNAIAPGFIETDMIKTVPEEILDKLRAQVPLKRLGKPEDIANAYLFLASGEAAYINGTVLNVDGALVI